MTEYAYFAKYANDGTAYVLFRLADVSGHPSASRLTPKDADWEFLPGGPDLDDMNIMAISPGQAKDIEAAFLAV